MVMSFVGGKVGKEGGGQRCVSKKVKRKSESECAILLDCCWFLLNGCCLLLIALP